MNGDPEITAEFYGEGDHIADDHRGDYTRLFLQRLGDHLRGMAR